MGRSKGGKTRVETLPVRFWSKVVRASDDDCWLWIGCKSKGYGQIQVVDKMELAHRVSLRFTGIEIPDGMQVDHTCNNRLCVNPNHLRVCTPGQNQINKSISSRNSTGFKGVSKQGHKWRALIALNKVDYFLGVYDTPEEAHAAYVAGAKRLHGEFANYRNRNDTREPR